RVLPIDTVLQPFLRKVWVFESQNDVPLTDIKTVVPSGHITLTFTYKGNYSTLVNSSSTFHTRESTLSLIGHQSKPVLLSGGGHVVTVGVSFKPFAAYRFFPFPLQDVSDMIIPGDDLFTRDADLLVEQLLSLGEPDRMAMKLQEFLISKLSPANNLEKIAHYTIDEIFRQKGQLPISSLANKTGYSQRHMNRVFNDIVGISPKDMARIIRIKHILSVPRDSSLLLGADYLDHFFDQAHYIKEFKYFTGYTPHRYTRVENSFGSLFNRLE
ncbi:AraC family transcriptional regulator, partial [Pontibacter ummariensis]